MASFWEPRAGLGRSWERLGAGERKKKKQCKFQGGPGGALGTHFFYIVIVVARRLWAIFDSLFGASGRHLDDICYCFSESCFRSSLNGLFDRFGNRFSIIFVISFDLFRITF